MGLSIPRMALTPFITALCVVIGITVLILFAFCFRSCLRHGGQVGDEEQSDAVRTSMTNEAGQSSQSNMPPPWPQSSRFPILLAERRQRPCLHINTDAAGLASPTGFRKVGEVEKGENAGGGSLADREIGAELAKLEARGW